MRPLSLALSALLAGLSAAALARGEGKVEEGKPAPDFSLPATQIDKVLPDAKDKTTLSLKDLKGKNVVLYFYPKALTGG
jgi:peroxiredoxin Q/BCP